MRLGFIFIFCTWEVCLLIFNPFPPRCSNKLVAGHVGVLQQMVLLRVHGRWDNPWSKGRRMMEQWIGRRTFQQWDPSKWEYFSANQIFQNKRQKVDGWQSSMIVNKCISLKTNTKNSGWKTTFLLQWPLIRGRFSLQGCICKYPWLFMIVFYRYKPSIKLLYLTTPTCLPWWRVRNMLNPRLHLALLSLKPTFPKAKLKYFYGRISVSSTDIENAKALVHKSHSWHLLKKNGLFL